MTNNQMKSDLNNEFKAEGIIRKIKKVTEVGVHTVLIFADGVDMKTLEFLNNRFTHGISIDEKKTSMVFINTPNQRKAIISDPRTITFFEVQANRGGYSGKNGQYTFTTEQEAIDMITEFKANPRSHNEKMTDDNVKYWKSQTYTVIKKTITTEELVSI